MEEKKFTILSEEQVKDTTEEIGGKCEATDFAIVLGAFTMTQKLDFPYPGGDKVIKSGRWFLRPNNDDGKIISEDGKIENSISGPNVCLRPVIEYSDLSELSTNLQYGESGMLEVEYGEYPQTVADSQFDLEDEYRAYKEGHKSRLKKTGKTYTINLDSDKDEFKPLELDEFEYDGKRYVRVINRQPSCCSLSKPNWSNSGHVYNSGDPVWIEVCPIKWYVDEKSKKLISKKLLVAGIRCWNDDKEHHYDYEKTDACEFLNTCFATEIIPSKSAHEKNEEEQDIDISVKAENTMKKYKNLQDLMGNNLKYENALKKIEEEIAEKETELAELKKKKSSIEQEIDANKEVIQHGKV